MQGVSAQREDGPLHRHYSRSWLLGGSLSPFLNLNELISHFNNRAVGAFKDEIKKTLSLDVPRAPVLSFVRF